ncbi:MAG: LPS translocon maturation chaperone LptM [Haliea sp.]|jgi:predicted small lipoprotein YifL
MRMPLPITALALALLALTGCGQTGPLQLPPRDAPAAGQAAPADDREAAPASNG